MRPPSHILIRLMLWPLSVAYGAAVRGRTAAFRRGWLQVEKLSVPVISVGNLTVGGTGKTPLVAKVCTLLQQEGMRAAVVSRGYGRRGNAPTVVSRGDGTGPVVDVAAAGDEPYLLAEALRTTPVVVAARRAEGARLAVDELGAQVVVADDAFQHHRLGRDLDLLVLDATNPTQAGWLLPAGGLREPLDAAGRAGAFVLTHCDRIGHTTRTEELFRPFNATAPFFHTIARPVEVIRTGGESIDPAALAGEPVLAFCGLGNPRFFEEDLRRLGIDVRVLVAFPDHHWYTDEDLEALSRRARETHATTWITTEKDCVRLSPSQLGAHPIARLRIEMEIWEERRFRKFLTEHLRREAAA